MNSTNNLCENILDIVLTSVSVRPYSLLAGDFCIDISAVFLMCVSAEKGSLHKNELLARFRIHPIPFTKKFYGVVVQKKIHYQLLFSSTLAERMKGSNTTQTYI